MIGAGALVKCLELENVEVVFGYPGAVICRGASVYPLSSVRGVVPENCIYKRAGEVGQRV